MNDMNGTELRVNSDRALCICCMGDAQEPSFNIRYNIWILEKQTPSWSSAVENLPGAAPALHRSDFS